MISLSKRQALATQYFYGQEYIDDLAGFLQSQNISTILECGCGDGYILHGLAQKGFRGLGIDADQEMIALAQQNNAHPNVEYRLMDWLTLSKGGQDFDLVMCRGGSIGYVSSWGKSHVDPAGTYAKIVESINQMFQKVTRSGILYVDTVPQQEIDKNGGMVTIKTDQLEIHAKITYDWDKRIRIIHADGRIGSHVFQGEEACSYLLTPTELEGMINAHHPTTIWRPALANERYYDIICARK